VTEGEPLDDRDRAEVRELITRADEMATLRDAEGYLALFASDAELTGTRGRASGTAALRAQIAEVWAREPVGTIHATMNAMVLDGSTREVANATSRLVSIDAARNAILGTAFVRHRLRHDDSGWRFTARDVR
jgi:hypothetical protein